MVRGRRGRGGTSGAPTAEGGPGGGEQGLGGGAQRGDDCGEAGDADAEADDGVGMEGQPTTDDLHRAWLGEVALVKRLRGQGVSDCHPVMRAACDSREAAEKAWRGSREPAPASVRLGRAQAKLDRAVALQAEARQAMLEAEREHQARMSALQATMDDCTGRVRMRRQQLREVQQEVGAGSGQATEMQRAQRAAIRQVHETLCGDVGPTIASLVEQLDTGAPAWAALNGVLGKLAASKATLEEASSRPADSFDIGDGDDAGEDGSVWSESRELSDHHGGGGGPGERWQAWMEGQHHDAEQDLMDTDEPADSPTRRWGGNARWQACGHGNWARASWADQMEAEGDGQDGADGGDGQPPAARRRLEGADCDQAAKGAGDASRQQQQQPASQEAGASGSGGGPVEGCGTVQQARGLSTRLDQIVTMAVQAGVTPLTRQGEELHKLTEAQLEAWVAECLPAALLC